MFIFVPYTIQSKNFVLVCTYACVRTIYMFAFANVFVMYIVFWECSKFVLVRCMCMCAHIVYISTILVGVVLYSNSSFTSITNHQCIHGRYVCVRFSSLDLWCVKAFVYEPIWWQLIAVLNLNKCVQIIWLFDSSRFQ